MKTGRLKRAIDIYSFGVVLLEILSGKLANDPTYIAEDEYGIAHVARPRFEENTIREMVDPKIMEEVDELKSTLHKGPNQDSLGTFLEVAYRCVAITQDERPIANDILQELEKALSFQVSKNVNSYSIEIKNRDDYKLMAATCKHIHEDRKLGLIVFEGIKEQIAPESLSAFQVIASQCLESVRKKRPRAEEVLQQLNKALEFQIPHMERHMYVNLKYTKGSETLHAYFATWRDNDWMMIELWRFLNHKKDSDRF
ncbi:putative non-specific serine/threonine protein kinase [Helianthus anomalus]